MPSVAPADRDPNLLRALVERFSSLPRAINNKGPRAAFDVYVMAERQGYAPCPPWPARIAPAERCPNLLRANLSNDSHPYLAP
jgi:hypothetical protein